LQARVQSGELSYIRTAGQSAHCRTGGVPLAQGAESAPSPAVAVGQTCGRLLIGVAAVSVAGAVLPYTPLGVLLGFTPLPLSLLSAISLLALTYLILVQAIKTWFYRRHALL